MTFTSPPPQFFSRDTLFATNLNSAFSYVEALVAAETNRAKNAESSLTNMIANYSFGPSLNVSVSGYATVSALNAEITRAETAEASLANSISNNYLPLSGGTITGKLGVIGSLITSTITANGAVSIIGNLSGNTAVFTSNLTASNLIATGEIVSAHDITAFGDITSFSDIKLKENITTITDGLDIIKHIRGVRFDRKDTKQKGIGVIAQEIADYIPEVVHDSNGTLSVAYGNIVGVLIEAIKTLSTKVDELEYKLLNNNIN